MPHRRLPPLRILAPPTLRGRFNERYEELEAQRAALVARLGKLGETARQNPGCKCAFKLLNEKFRTSKLPQRLAVLQAAAWLIDILEQITIGVI